MVNVQTDAYYEAAGAFFSGDWRYLNFPMESRILADPHVNDKELLAAVMADEIWSSLWANKQIIIHSDSQTTVTVINKGTTRNPIVMFYLCRLFWYCTIFNFRITAKYIPGNENTIADAISRMHDLLYFWHCIHYLSLFNGLESVIQCSLLCNMPYNSALFLSPRFY